MIPVKSPKDTWPVLKGIEVREDRELEKTFDIGDKPVLIVADSNNNILVKSEKSLDLKKLEILWNAF